MPVDVDPHPDGNVEMTGRKGTTSRGQSAPEVRVVAAQSSLFGDDEPTRYMPHFATCPNAEDFRGKVNAAEVGGAPSRHDQPETAAKAGKLVRKGTQHAAILLDLREAPVGRTAHELATLDTHLVRMRPGIPPNQAATRIDELRKRGLVERLTDDAGAVVTRRAATGDAEVHRLTPQGRVEASRLRAALEADR